eukprot:7036205-Ditylum_brightwellii.AAC.1
MGDLFADSENVQAYTGNLLVLTKGNWEDHLAKLNKVLTRSTKAGLKELEYLGYWITQEGV